MRQLYHRAGLSLIEVIVAIVLLGLVLTAATRLVGISVQKVGENARQITAVYLAQEGMELVRNFRDRVVQGGGEMGCFLQQGVEHYTVELTTVASVPLSHCAEVVNGSSTYGVGILPITGAPMVIETPQGSFTRTVSLTPYDLSTVAGYREGDAGYTVTVMVTGDLRTPVVVETLLTPWQE